MDEECFFLSSSFFEQSVGINGILSKDLKLDNISFLFLFTSCFLVFYAAYDDDIGHNFKPIYVPSSVPDYFFF